MTDNKSRGIEEIIQQAMREGAFDDLPGKGRPLKLDENPYLDREWQLAYHLLKQNGFAPEFIEKRQAIEMELASAREKLARAWAWRRRAVAEDKPSDWVRAEWERAKTDFEKSIAKTNVEIRNYNLHVPIHSLHKLPVSIVDELKPFQD